MNIIKAIEIIRGVRDKYAAMALIRDDPKIAQDCADIAEALRVVIEHYETNLLHELPVMTAGDWYARRDGMCASLHERYKGAAL